MKHRAAILCTLALLMTSPAAWGKVPADDVAGNEFPGLQLLPPGSKIKGISLPRYEKHRVTALIMADLMEILTRSDLAFTTIRANLYAENGELTKVNCQKADYSFRDKMVKSTTTTEVDSTSFTAKGTGVTFSTATNVGFLHGAVHTTVKNAALNKKPKGQ
mgnify:CR=1 FL=1